MLKFLVGPCQSLLAPFRLRRLAIGHSYDIHRVEEIQQKTLKPLKLGGVVISNRHEIVAHSDGDCLLHAISDALLGAAGLPDIGQLFPDKCEEWRDVESAKILKTVLTRLHDLHIKVLSVDCTVILEAVKIAPFKKPIIESVKTLLGSDAIFLNLKARTNEGLDAIGKGKAVACHVVVLVERR